MDVDNIDTPRAELADLLLLPADVVAAAEVTGPTRMLPSVFPVTAAATAAVGVATSAVASVVAARTGAPPAHGVDTAHAAAAFRSERAVRVDGATLPAWDSLAGDYRCDDGWIRLHTNFARHRVAATGVLGGVGDRPSVAAAVSGWRGDDLEAAVVAAGGAAAALRPEAAWAAHPHGSRVRDQPVVAVERVADAPTVPPPPGPRALGGLRVLDLTRVIAGPVACRFLAAHGADVLRVDGPGLPDVEACVVDGGFGKRATEVDLARDRDSFLALVADADVVVQAYRPGALDRLGLGVDELVRASPGLVAVNLSAYGGAGPWAGRRGFDSLVQMSSGIAHRGMVAAGADAPVPLPCQALDHATGYLAAAGALAAVRRRAAEGGSWRVDVSLARTAAWLTDLSVDPDGADLADPGEALTDAHLLVDDTPIGRVAHVSCPGWVDGYRVGWDRAVRPRRSDPPRW